MGDDAVEARLIGLVEIVTQTLRMRPHELELGTVEGGAGLASDHLESLERPRWKAGRRHGPGHDHRGTLRCLHEDRGEGLALDFVDAARRPRAHHAQWPHEPAHYIEVVDQRLGDHEAGLERHEGLALERRAAAARIGQEARGKERQVAKEPAADLALVEPALDLAIPGSK